jgi:CRISPR-associated protein Csm2
MASISLWQDKANKQVDPRLFSTIAEDLAIAISEEGKIDDKGYPIKDPNRFKNKSTQLRRFFDELLRINTRAQSEGDDWNLTHPMVHMMVAKTAYAHGRKLVTASFVKLMRDGITSIDDQDDLHVFTNFMESFMGFYKLYRPK